MAVLVLAQNEWPRNSSYFYIVICDRWCLLLQGNTPTSARPWKVEVCGSFRPKGSLTLNGIRASKRKIYWDGDISAYGGCCCYQLPQITSHFSQNVCNFSLLQHSVMLAFFPISIHTFPTSATCYIGPSYRGAVAWEACKYRGVHACLLIIPTANSPRTSICT